MLEFISKRGRDATQRSAPRRSSSTARSTVQRNALIRVAACAEFERLTDPRDTHVSDGITRSSVRSRDVPGDASKTARANFFSRVLERTFKIMSRFAHN